MNLGFANNPLISTLKMPPSTLLKFECKPLGESNKEVNRDASFGTKISNHDKPKKFIGASVTEYKLTLSRGGGASKIDQPLCCLRVR